ncbi:hypothetical protein FRC03_010958 [Tulasnella sp. 419]|nr:hypothetical protein FRC03_010958 [Tulasnella sp. 419]
MELSDGHVNDPPDVNLCVGSILSFWNMKSNILSLANGKDCHSIDDMLRALILFICFLLIQSQEIQATPIGTNAEEGPVDAGHVVPRATAAVDCPIYLYTYNFKSDTGLRVGGLASGWAALGAPSVGSSYSYTQTATGSYFSASTRCPLPAKTSYLTVDELYPASYKPLVWTSTKNTNYWALTNGAVVARRALGGTLYTVSSSPYGYRTTFLACGSDKRLYLQTGNDVPDATCQTVSLLIEVYA